MLTTEDRYVSPAGSPENHQSEPLASLPQRCADWISYAAAVIQQAVPKAADFTESTTR